MMFTERYIPDTVCTTLWGKFDAESTCHTLGFVDGGSFGRVSNNEFWKFDYNTETSTAIESEIPTLTELNSTYCVANSANVSMCEDFGWGHCGNHRNNVLLTCNESG